MNSEHVETLLDGKSALLVTTSSFLEERRGCAARMRGLVRGLQSVGCRTHVFSASRAVRWPRHLAKRAGIASVSSVNSRWRDIYLVLRRYVPEVLPYAVKFLFWHRRWARECMRKREGIRLTGFRDEGVVRALAEACREIRPDVVVVEYAYLAYALDAICASPVTVIDTHDVIHLRQSSFEDRGIHHWLETSRDEEAAALKRFDIIVAIQDSDAEEFRRMVPGATVVTVLPCLSFPDDGRVNLAGPGKKRVVVVGSSSIANAEGLIEFLRDAWPLVLKNHPKAELAVCGRVCTYLKAHRAPGVRLLGPVRDLAGLYASADVVISPVTFGGGIKIKCAEAFAHGKACVLTEHSTVGYEEGRGYVYRAAANWSEFGREVSDLLGRPGYREQLGHAARQYAMRRFSPEATVRDLAANIRGQLSPAGSSESEGN
jgi:glycosyltransferase involved in cell wall biosynthesis